MPVKSTKSTQPKEKASKPKKRDYIYTKGGRKEATALVKLFPQGQGEILINEKDYREYFPYFELQQIVEAPLKLIKQKDKFNLSIKVSGGGKRGQAEAIRHGIARALIKLNPLFRKPLKKAGFLKRDPRAKERKKPGLKRARRAPQWQKR
jgi:small subunit ribosomal protein S9